jgi:exonuclease V gamma subunit
MFEVDVRVKWLRSWEEKNDIEAVGKRSSYQSNFFFALTYRSAALKLLVRRNGLWP